MARGWESKSVEEQQAETMSEKPEKIQLNPQEIAQRQVRDGLALSRNRVLQQLQSASQPIHRRMLELALADLDAQITRLG